MVVETERAAKVRFPLSRERILTAAPALSSTASGKVRPTKPLTTQPNTAAHSARTYPTRTPSTRRDAATSGHSTRT